VVELARNFRRQEPVRVASWRSQLARLAKDGPLAVWGAGAKGATFVNLADPGAELVDCVVDVNPRKQGKFVPGTAHPIVPPAELAGRGVRAALLMNPNYRTEVQELLTALGSEVRLVEGAS
jgi:hypothetical protein